MKTSRRIGRQILLSLMLVLAVCQVPHRRFFLGQIWLGSPLATQTMNPAGQFSLVRIQPVVVRQTPSFEKASDVWTVIPAEATQRDPAIVSVPLRRLYQSFQPTLLLSRPSSGRSPPAPIH